MRQLGMDFHNFWPNARMSAAQYRLLIDRLEGERIRRLAELAEQERQQEAERQEREKLAEEIRWPRLTGPVCVKCGFVKQTCRTFDRDSTHQYTPPPLCVVCLFPEKDCRKFDRDRTHEFIPPVGGVRHLGRIEVAQDGRQVVVWDDGSRGPILDRCPDCNQHIDTEGHPDSCPLGRGITFFPLVPLHALESRHIVRHGRSTPSTDRK
jgi:hypothetical protein